MYRVHGLRVYRPAGRIEGRRANKDAREERRWSGTKWEAEVQLSVFIYLHSGQVHADKTGGIECLIQDTHSLESLVHTYSSNGNGLVSLEE